MTKTDAAVVLNVSQPTFLKLLAAAKYAGVQSPFHPMHGSREYAKMPDLKAFIVASGEAGILPRKLSKLLPTKRAA